MKKVLIVIVYVSILLMLVKFGKINQEAKPLSDVFYIHINTDIQYCTIQGASLFLLVSLFIGGLIYRRQNHGVPHDKI